VPYLILSDIHANLEALDACIAEKASLAVPSTAVRSETSSRASTGAWP
jgi:hypothetical protein